MPDSSFSIRAIRDDDDLDDLHEGNSEWPGAAFARKMTAAAATEDAVIAFQVAEHDGRLLGYLDGFLAPHDNPTRAGSGGVWVRPDARGHGVGSALLDALLSSATERGARRLTSRVDSTDLGSIRWLEAHGGTTGGIHLESKLELGDDLPLFPPPPGVTVETLRPDADEAEWQAAYEASVRLMGDTPDAETNPAPIPYGVYRALLAHSWQLCLAKTDDGAIVGLTCVFPKNERVRSVNTMLTAVNREWRGQGLATALKTLHAVRLRHDGWRSIVTQNMEGNDHILAANRRLGFQPSKAMLDAIYDFPVAGA